MKKSLLLAGLFLGSLAMASENSSAMTDGATSMADEQTSTSVYIAVGGGKGKETMKGSVSTYGYEFYNGSFSDDGTLFSINGGVLIDNTHRVNLEYSRYNTDSDVSMYSIGLAYDYRIDIQNLPTFKPFIGVSYMYITIKEDLPNVPGIVWDTASATLNTSAIAARVGADFDITKNFYVSVLFDISLYTSGSTTVGMTYQGYHYEEEDELDKFSRGQLLLGYRF